MLVQGFWGLGRMTAVLAPQEGPSIQSSGPGCPVPQTLAVVVLDVVVK